MRDPPRYAVYNTWMMGASMPRRDQNTCPHESLHIEILMGQRTGDRVCDDCGLGASPHTWVEWRKTAPLPPLPSHDPSRPGADQCPECGRIILKTGNDLCMYCGYEETKPVL